MSKSAIVLKVILLGNGMVGKSSLMHRYVNNIYREDSYSTIGVEFLRKEVTVNNQKYLLQIWDTAGQEKYRSLITPFYRGSDICVLVFSLNNRETFDNVELWLREFYKHGDITPNESFPILLFGNKCDLGEHAVDYNKVLEWCTAHGQGLKNIKHTNQRSGHSSSNIVYSSKDGDNVQCEIGLTKQFSFDASLVQNGVPYLETSAKENTNVELGFIQAIKLWEMINSTREITDLLDSQRIILRKNSRLSKLCCSRKDSEFS